MKNTYAAFCVFVLCNALCSSKMLPTILPISFTSCKDGPQTVQMEYRKVGDKGEKAWFGNITMPFLLDANSEFTIELYSWKKNDWEKTGNDLKGKVCFYMDKFGKEMWLSARKHAKPPMDDCETKPGLYVYDNYIADYSKVLLPGIQKGKGLAKITITKEKKVFCGMIRADIL